MPEAVYKRGEWWHNGKRVAAFDYHAIVPVHIVRYRDHDETGTISDEALGRCVFGRAGGYLGRAFWDARND